MKNKKWKPKYNEFFWYVDSWGHLEQMYWEDLNHQDWNYRTGNVHRTKKEAMAYRKKLITLGKS